MASKNITTAAGRDRLAPRPELYYFKVSKGRFIGYRKNVAGGTWLARYTLGTNKTIHRLGTNAQLYVEHLLLRSLQHALVVAHQLMESGPEA